MCECLLPHVPGATPYPIVPPFHHGRPFLESHSTMPVRSEIKIFLQVTERGSLKRAHLMASTEWPRAFSGWVVMIRQLFNEIERYSRCCFEEMKRFARVIDEALRNFWIVAAAA